MAANSITLQPGEYRKSAKLTENLPQVSELTLLLSQSNDVEVKKPLVGETQGVLYPLLEMQEEENAEDESETKVNERRGTISRNMRTLSVRCPKLSSIPTFSTRVKACMTQSTLLTMHRGKIPRNTIDLKNWHSVEQPRIRSSTTTLRELVADAQSCRPLDNCQFMQKSSISAKAIKVREASCRNNGEASANIIHLSSTELTRIFRKSKKLTLQLTRTTLSSRTDTLIPDPDETFGSLPEKSPITECTFSNGSRNEATSAYTNTGYDNESGCSALENATAIGNFHYSPPVTTDYSFGMQPRVHYKGRKSYGGLISILDSQLSLLLLEGVDGSNEMKESDIAPFPLEHRRSGLHMGLRCNPQIETELQKQSNNFQFANVWTNDLPARLLFEKVNNELRGIQRLTLRSEKVLIRQVKKIIGNLEQGSDPTGRRMAVKQYSCDFGKKRNLSPSDPLKDNNREFEQLFQAATSTEKTNDTEDALSLIRDDNLVNKLRSAQYILQGIWSKCEMDEFKHTVMP